MTTYNGVKVFSATKCRDRDVLGERITDWLRRNRAEVIGKTVSQSSDREYHCISIVLFYRCAPAAKRRRR